MNKEDFVIQLYKLGLIKIGQFKLSSGKESPFYIDLRELISYPKLLKKIASAIVDSVRNEIDFDVIAGIATGGIPLASYISCIYDIPMAYVRKEEKYHGTQKLVEGNVRGKRILLVDDVATTGGSLKRAINALRAEQGQVNYAIVIVDREQGAKQLLNKLNVTLKSLITAREIFAVLYRNNFIKKNTYVKILNYISSFY